MSISTLLVMAESRKGSFVTIPEGHSKGAKSEKTRPFSRRVGMEALLGHQEVLNLTCKLQEQPFGRRGDWTKGGH